MKKKALLLSLLTGMMSVNASAYISTYVGGSVGIEDVAASTSLYRAWTPALFFGYSGSYEKDFYLAAELAAMFTATLTNNYVNRDDSLRMTPVLSLSVLPGMKLVPGAIGFIRLGLAEAYVPAPGTWRTGGIFGVGLDVDFTPCWSVRSEYDYSVYRSIGIGTPRTDMFLVSLKYTFDT